MIPLVTSAEVAFWLLAPIMVVLALGMVISRKPVHSALCLVFVMVGLAVQYAAMEAPFLFVIQIIVYTGAIMMLFLFVLMLVGVDTRESLVETIRHHRVWSIIIAFSLGIMLVFAVGNAVVAPPKGLAEPTEAAGGNVQLIAEVLFTRWVFAFEATAALLITAAVGAMVLAHGERIFPKIGQRETMEERMRRYAEHGEHLGPRPSSGVYARTNAIHAPALLPDGSEAESSISHTLAERTVIYDSTELIAPTRSAFAEFESAREELGEGDDE